MRVVIVYRSGTEREREAAGWLREFEHRTHKTLEYIDPDTPNGNSFCRVYDIVEYPTIIAINSDGKIQNTWRGLPMPLISEVSYYVQ